MDERNIRCDVFHLVHLKVSDEMPLNVGRQRFSLLFQFLNAAFAENALPFVVGFLDERSGVELRYGHKANTRRNGGLYFFKM